LWLVVATTLQPVLVSGHSNAPGSGESRISVPGHAFLLATPVDQPTLLKLRAGDRDLDSEKRGPERGHADRGSPALLDLRYGSYRARHASKRLASPDTRGRAHTPRAPPLIRG